jgi:hypothetical protein
MKKCIAKTADVGNFNTTHIAINGDGTLLATGSKMGVVNFFSIDESSKTLTSNQEPSSTVMNLTTAITDLKFNSTG